jgi:hypothetical protein
MLVAICIGVGLNAITTEVLAQEENLAGLNAISRDLIAKAESVDSQQRVVLDMDSTEIPVYLQEEHSAYNGHFESTCYHPQLLFIREGDCLAAKLRSGEDLYFYRAQRGGKGRCMPETANPIR